MRIAAKYTPFALILGFALATAPLAGAAGAPIEAGPPVNFPDPIGDSGTAPDMTSVIISNDATGRIDFSILIPGTELPANARVFLVLDTDINQTTGDPVTGGGDYYFVIRGADRTYTLYRWSGSAWEPSDSSTASVRYASGAYISIDRSQLGDTAEFAFYAKTRTDGEGAETGRVDFVPDSGTETYVLPLQIPDPPPTVALKQVVAVGSGTARAGKPYTVRVSTVVAVDGRKLAVPPSQLSCTATIAGRRLRTVVASNGTLAQACSFVIPSNARGKQLAVALKGRVMVTVEGTDSDTTFTTSFSKTLRSKIR